MEIKGKIIHALPEVSGTSQAGKAWKKREYVLETQDNFPRKVHFDFFGERADQYPLNVGDDITLSFDIESREYNGRWFTSIRGWKADKNVPGGNGGNYQPQDPGFPPTPSNDFPPAAQGGDDLPF